MVLRCFVLFFGLIVLKAVLFCMNCSMLLYYCLIPSILLGVAVLLFVRICFMLAMLLYVPDKLFYMALVCPMLLHVPGCLGACLMSVVHLAL